MSKLPFDAFGYILKEENYEKLTSKILPNTTVLENVGAYPGYNGKDLPADTSVPGHLFFVQKQVYTWEDMMRKTHKIKKFFNGNFVMSQATLRFGNKDLECIRVKNLPTYDSIIELQNSYIHEGVKFEKSIQTSLVALTKVRKYFILEERSDLVMSDIEVKDIHYLKFPRIMNWELFRKITMMVRNNLGLNYNFDAAIGVIYRRDLLIDVVRIYSPDISLEELTHIQKMYMTQYERYQAE